MRKVQVYDTTLRDGMQGQGMSLSAQEKVRVVRKLDELGIHFIEAGFPASNPKELELFEMLAEVELAQGRICAFGMTRRRDTEAAEDEALRILATGFAPVVTLVGKTWGLHLEKVTKVSREENLAMIGDSVGYLRGADKRVIYDAEHFFDGYRDDPGYALECLRVAADAGAENVTLCDTNGSTLPAEVAEATGASLVQGTMNGIGERTGNANLTSILPALQLKMGHRCVSDGQLARLTGIAHFIDELLNITPDPDQPFVGRNAFAHKGGMHVAGVSADARTFEHMDPAEVGNEREMVVSELSGKGTVLERAERAGIPLDEEQAAKAVRTLKEREHRGYHYEAADASFDLLLRRETGRYEPLFRLEGFRVLVEKREDGKVVTEATIKVWVDGERYLRTAEGNGPVNALDTALRGAIIDRHPHLADIELTNYKVRILDEHHGTGAVTRVLLDSSDGEREWGSIGVSENIIEASWEALIDSLEYAFQPREEGAAPSERADTARTP
jgi:2-isopropylmalate synthase